MQKELINSVKHRFFFNETFSVKQVKSSLSAVDSVFERHEQVH